MSYIQYVLGIYVIVYHAFLKAENDEKSAHVFVLMYKFQDRYMLHV